VGIDRDSDLAVLKIDRTGCHFCSWGFRGIAAGATGAGIRESAGAANSVTMGVVSSMARQIKRTIR